MGKRTKLPKRVAGVKLPKSLRRTGGTIKDWVQGPIFSNIVASAMIGAAAALADTKRGKAAKRKAGELAAGAAKAVKGGGGRKAAKRPKPA